MLVPMAAAYSPGAKTPRPRVATPQSPPPLNTGVSAGRASSVAVSAVSRPTISVFSTMRSGIMVRGTPMSSISS